MVEQPEVTEDKLPDQSLLCLRHSDIPSDARATPAAHSPAVEGGAFAKWRSPACPLSPASDITPLEDTLRGSGWAEGTNASMLRR